MNIDCLFISDSNSMINHKMVKNATGNYINENFSKPLLLEFQKKFIWFNYNKCITK
jgi:hypothetical protein